MSSWDRHPPVQEPDRVGGLWTLALTLFVLAVIAGSVGWAWVLLARAAPGAQRLDAAGETAEHLRAAGPEVAGLLQEPIERRRAEPDADPEVRAARGRLATWGWADPQHRRAHIPIERAMRLVLARGLGADPATAPISADPPTGAAGDRGGAAPAGGAGAAAATTSPPVAGYGDAGPAAEQAGVEAGVLAPSRGRGKG